MPASDQAQEFRRNAYGFGELAALFGREGLEMVLEHIAQVYLGDTPRSTIAGVYQQNNSHYKGAMDIKEIRRENLRLLAKDKGGQARLAELLGMSLSYLGQIIGKNPVKGIGDAIARRVEKELELPHGWMDQAHSLSTMSPDIFVRAVRLVEDAMSAEKLSIHDAEKRARLYLMVYRRLQTATLDLSDVRELVRLAA